jgi:hypothetical protein
MIRLLVTSGLRYFTNLFENLATESGEMSVISLGTLVSSTSKTDCHNITEILFKLVLNTIILTLNQCIVVTKSTKQVYEVIQNKGKDVFGTSHNPTIIPTW